MTTNGHLNSLNITTFFEWSLAEVQLYYIPQSVMSRRIPLPSPAVPRPGLPSSSSSSLSSLTSVWLVVGL
jgi:hypothetical protein